MKKQEIDILARTLWGEARGEGETGMQAVANVVMRRVQIGGWWGNTVIRVCRKPYQFSCWNTDDLNYERLMSVDGRNRNFAAARRIAKQAVCGNLKDITQGADHYHAAGVFPMWILGQRPVAVIGDHIFYKLTKGKKHV